MHPTVVKKKGEGLYLIHMLREVARKDFLTILNDWSLRGPVSRNFAKTDWDKAAGYSWGVGGGWAVAMAAGKVPSQVLGDTENHVCVAHCRYRQRLRGNGGAGR